MSVVSDTIQILNKKKKGHKMSLSLINKLFAGCLFIHNEKNYLIEWIREINDETETISVWLVDSKADFEVFTGSYSEFKSKVVK
jgi:uncharacterized protein involved in tolerance to divalent cations